MRELARGILELLQQPACCYCGAAVGAEALCWRCDRALLRLPRDRCRRCQERPAAPGEICAVCAARPSPLSACFAAAPFDGEVERWIHRFKYPQRGLAGLDPAALAVVGQLVREAAARAPGSAADLLVPIPMHPRRLRGRGFNPAALLARALACTLSTEWDPGALQRLRDTPSQTGLGRRARARNVHDALAATRRVPERVWLVDDVVTTGSTLEAAATALRRAGARQVVAVCAARTLSEQM